MSLGPLLIVIIKKQWTEKNLDSPMFHSVSLIDKAVNFNRNKIPG